MAIRRPEGGWVSRLVSKAREGVSIIVFEILLRLFPHGDAE
jgi:hypothetical protein